VGGKGAARARRGKGPPRADVAVENGGS
jgi:hypothetical protein